MIYLDLEDTIIDNWSRPDLIINERALRYYFKHHNISEISVFSHAIYTFNEVYEFDKMLRDELQGLLNVRINTVLSLSDMISAASRIDGIEYHSLGEYLHLNSKFFSFTKYCMSRHKGEDCLLIDDSVLDTELLIKNEPNNTIIRTLNIETVKNFYRDRPQNDNLHL